MYIYIYACILFAYKPIYVLASLARQRAARLQELHRSRTEALVLAVQEELEKRMLKVSRHSSESRIQDGL